MIITKTAYDKFAKGAPKKTRKKVPVLSEHKNMVIRNLFQ